MLEKLRGVLLTQHIGAMVVALLCWQAAIVLITGVLRLAFGYFRQPPQSVFGAPVNKFDWSFAITSVVTTAIYLLAAYLLVRWLYPAVVAEPAEIEGADA
jgi:hypothetical protein